MYENHSIITVRKTFSILAKPGVVEILLLINENGSANYKDLLAIASSEPTLVRRIKELMSLHILKREILDEKYKPTKYTLTELGNKYVELIEMICVSV